MNEEFKEELDKNGDLVSIEFEAGERKYKFDIKETKKSEKYIVVHEINQINEEKIKKTKLMIFQNQIKNFVKHFNKAIQEIYPSEEINLYKEISTPIKKKKRNSSEKAYTLDDKRKIHPNAYRKWTQEDNELLLEFHEQGKSTKELSDLFGRDKGAIQSRIKKILEAE